MTVSMLEMRSSLITSAVVGFSLFSKMMNPANSRSLSTSVLDIFWALTQLSFFRCFVAHPMTRYPL